MDFDDLYNKSAIALRNGEKVGPVSHKLREEFDSQFSFKPSKQWESLGEYLAILDETQNGADDLDTDKKLSESIDKLLPNIDAELRNVLLRFDYFLLSAAVDFVEESLIQCVGNLQIRQTLMSPFYHGDYEECHSNQDIYLQIDIDNFAAIFQIILPLLHKSSFFDKKCEGFTSNFTG